MEFLETYWQEISSILIGVFSFLCFLITFIRTGSVKKAINDFKEVENMKFKKLSENSKISHSQDFSDFVPNYVFNPVTNELELLKTDKNIQAYIDSHIDCALNNALNKFLPNVVEEEDVVADYAQAVDDMASLGEAMELAEEYREKYNLPDNYSMAQIYDFVGKQASEIKAHLNKEQEVKGNGSSSSQKTE